MRSGLTTPIDSDHPLCGELFVTVELFVSQIVVPMEPFAVFEQFGVGLEPSGAVLTQVHDLGTLFLFDSSSAPD